MCVSAIARSGLGRVVFALSSFQLAELRGPHARAPDDAPVACDGPALPDPARGSSAQAAASAARVEAIRMAREPSRRRP